MTTTTADTNKARAVRRTIGAALLGCVAITVLLACQEPVAKPSASVPTAAPTKPTTNEPPGGTSTPPVRRNECVPNVKIHSTAATGGAIQGAIKDLVLYWEGTRSNVECLPEAQQNQTQLSRVGNTHEGTPTYRVIRVHRPAGAQYFMLKYLNGTPVCIIDVDGACDRMLSSLGNYDIDDLPAEVPALGGSTTPPPKPRSGSSSGSGATGIASISAGTRAAGTANISAGGSGTRAAGTANISAGGSGTRATGTVNIFTHNLVTGVTITNGGSGYTSSPTVTFSGGGGFWAAGVASITSISGTVTGVTITRRGSGYTSDPTVTFSGGGGTGARGTAVRRIDGQIDRVIITNGGSGYTSAPTVTFSLGGGSGAAGVASITSISGTVTGVTITNRGIGYRRPPTVTFSGGGGSGAVATASIGSKRPKRVWPNSKPYYAAGPTERCLAFMRKCAPGRVGAGVRAR